MADPTLPIIPVDQWEPCTPAVTCDPSSRDPNTLLSVVQQFGVTTQPRYQPVKNATTGAIQETFCNIFLWDTTSAMTCPIPHWVDPNGVPVAVGQGHELNANSVCDWLATCGPTYGWTPCTGDQAQAAANAGQPAVITWKNPTGASGHVAICVPTPPNESVIYSAQAGATNFVGQPYTQGFGDRTVIFYQHS